MSHTQNLLAPATVKLPTGIGGWSAEENCVLSPQINFSPYTENLRSTVQLNSLKVTPLALGDVSFATDEFVASAGNIFKGTVWIAADVVRNGSFSLRFLDSNNVLLDTETFTFTTLPNNWKLMYVYAVAPPSTSKGILALEIEDTLPNEGLWASYPTATQYNYQIESFVEAVEEQLPDFMVEADRNIKANPQRPLLRFIDIATNSITDATQTVREFDYVRATDSLDGEADNSSLTDPEKANFFWLGWLAQQAGVRLSITGSGFTEWAAFEAANIDQWEEWEQDIVPGGSEADTTWTAIETFDAETAENLDNFRGQIATGYNGVMSSSPLTIAAYTKTLLNTVLDDPFTFVRKHYRTNPWRLAVVVNSEENPDPTGATLADLIRSTVPAGTVINVLNGVSRSALVLYDASDFASHITSGLVDGYNELPVSDALELRFVEDTMGTNRHILLYDLTSVGDWFTGGGIAQSRYFAIVDNAGDHEPGHGLTSGAVEAVSGSDAGLDITGDIDIRVLVSDLRPGVGGSAARELMVCANKWRLLLDDASVPTFEWQNSGTQSKEATASLSTLHYRPFWLRVTLDADNGSAGHTVTFFTADTLHDEWTVLGDPVVTAGTSAIDSNATNGIRLFNKSTNPVDSASGTIYRAMVHDGIDGTEVLDINFLDTADNDIFTGATTFSENGPNTLTVTVEGADPGASNYDLSRWLLLNQVSGEDYFHFGKSPDLDDPGNGDDLGDTLTVSGLASANHQYLVTYYDGTNASAGLGTATSHVLSSDDPNFGGKAISSISITNVSGGAEVALFVPSLLPGATLTEDDGYGATWTLDRTFEDGAYYEQSSTIDRSCIMPITGEGVIRYGGFGFGASTGSFSYSAQSFSMTYRRFWNTASVRTNVVDNTIDSGEGIYGWKVDLFESSVEATLFDGIIHHTLTWDETGRIGEWNNIVLVLDPARGVVELWANGELVDTTVGFFPNQFLSLGGASVDFASIPDHASLDIAGDLEVRVHAASDDWFDAGLGAGFKLLAAKEGSWEFAYNQQTGLLRFSFEDGGTNSFTTSTTPLVDGKPIHLAANVDVDNGGGGYTIDILYSWDGVNWTSIEDDVTAGGIATIETSNNPVRIGASPGGTEPFDGRAYSLKVLDGSTLVLYANFSNTTEWVETSTAGDDETGTHTISLNGEATIDLLEKESLFPEYFPLGVTVHQSGFPLTYQFSKLAIYDHALNEVAIMGLFAENDISV